MTEEIITAAEDEEDVISGNTLKRLIEYMRIYAQCCEMVGQPNR